MQSTVGQQNIPVQQCNCPPQSVQQNNTPQYQTAPMQAAQPVQQYGQPQNQNVQVPNYSGVNIQIFNPSVTPPGATAPVYNVNAPNYGSTTATGCYPPDYYTKQFGQNTQTNTNNTTENKTTDKKTEKREIVQLTDDYIRSIENYLNNQDKEIRLMGAKEVLARLEEDHSRKDDKALNALINKMLQDPSSSVRFVALGALNSRVVSGDNLTFNLLQQMQNSQSGYGQEALEASNALLKMSGQVVEKEFEAKYSNSKDTKKETKYYIK